MSFMRSKALRKCALWSVAGIVALCSLVGITALAQGEKPSQILFKNAHVFDGVNEQRIENANVLVESNLIKVVSTTAIKAEGAMVIDGGGRTLMPGLIDSHVHLNVTGLSQTYMSMQAAKWDQIGAMASENARDYLYDGYTTVRDTGGMGSGLRELIDRGLVEGPRIYASGAVIGPTSGHGDFRNPVQREYGGVSSDMGTKLNISYIADSPDETRKAARLNFAHGASFLKLMAGGGVSSELDPLWSVDYTEDEFRAAVEAAEFHDTYVTVHAYTDRTVNTALDAGVKCLEHSQLVSEKTVKRIVEEGIFWSINWAGLSPTLLEHPNYALPSVRAKQMEYLEGSKNIIEYVKNYKPKILHNVDTVLSTVEFARQHRDFEKYYAAEVLGNHAFLVSATSTAGELAQLTGRKNPYPNKLGVIESGAYADLLIVDGNPLEDITVIGGNPKWFDAPERSRGHDTIKLIMKDGVIYKNTL